MTSNPNDAEADRALRAGGCVIGVRMGGKKDQKEEVAAILTAHHGQPVYYWSHWSVERLA